ncbi:hypothetical protein [Acidisoma sp. C75]
MNIAMRKAGSLTAFLEWEARQADRYEFDGIEPVGMTGSTVTHAAVQRNRIFYLAGGLRGKP